LGVSCLMDLPWDDYPIAGRQDPVSDSSRLRKKQRSGGRNRETSAASTTHSTPSLKSGRCQGGAGGMVRRPGKNRRGQRSRRAAMPSAAAHRPLPSHSTALPQQARASSTPPPPPAVASAGGGDVGGERSLSGSAQLPLGAPASPLPPLVGVTSGHGSGDGGCGSTHECGLPAIEGIRQSTPGAYVNEWHSDKMDR